MQPRIERLDDGEVTEPQDGQVKAGLPRGPALIDKVEVAAALRDDPIDAPARQRQVWAAEKIRGDAVITPRALLHKSADLNHIRCVGRVTLLWAIREVRIVAGAFARWHERTGQSYAALL